MVEKYQICPGLDLEFGELEDGTSSLSKFLSGAEIQGGSPCWLPHIPADAFLICEGLEIPYRKPREINFIAEGSYPELEIVCESFEDLEKNFRKLNG